MSVNIERRRKRIKRKKSIRRVITGTSERPRLSIFRSATNIYAQIIDDTTGNTLVSASSQSTELKKSLKDGRNVESAKKVGELLAKKAVESQIKTVSFDRNGYLYHGRVKALADSAREAGLQL